MQMDDILQRHRCFWQRTENSEPLVQKLHFGGYVQKPYPVSGGRSLVDPEQVLPEQMDVHRLLGLDTAPKATFDGLEINATAPVFPEAWMESLIGCAIYASAFSCTAKPVTGDIAKFAADFQLKDALQSPWLKVMDEVVQTAVDASAGKMPVPQLHLRGIVDMLAACLGEESLCLALADNSSQLEELIQDFTQLYIEVALRGLAMRPRWNGGYVSAWGLFAPGTLLDYQVDATSIMRADLYDKFFSKHDASIMSRFDHSLTHVHSCGLHMIDALLKIDQLSAIEISIDAEATVWNLARFTEYCQKVQSANKSVLVHGQVSQADLREMLASLSPVGLAIFYWN